MPDLAIATVCSAAIALVFKLGDRQGLSGAWTISANYAVALLVSLAIALSQRALPRHLSSDSGAFLSSLPGVLGSGGFFDPRVTPMWGLAIGAIAGILYLLGFVCYQRSVRTSGMALSGSFGKLGILVPVLASLLVWREAPDLLQSLGVVAALASMALALRFTRSGSDRQDPALLLLFLVGGLAEFSNKVYSRYASPGIQGSFLVAVFGVALLSSLFRLRGKRPRQGELLAGLALGIPNVLASQFLVGSLTTVPAPVAFSVYGAGSLLVINAVGVLAFREPLSPKQKIAVLLAAASLVLVSA